jgi:WD40 repeat protein
MIAKQLRKAEFTEQQIRELKLHRKFILICDGYDESQQSRNLYTSNRLNQPGEWNAKMIVSCRSEYIGADYRDRFQPVDRNHRSEGTTLFQEAVITPFSVGQIQEYITQYVSVYRPLWGADEYERALDLIPSLKELVRNPFLMSLSLEVLPRMIDPSQDLLATHITRVALYDQFIEHWLERGKKRLGEKKMGPLALAAFESLVDEGFTRNGIDYLKRLSAAIYKEQDGHPIVGYSRYKDQTTWKAEFFSREEEKQLLREACPLVRSGNQHRFIHRSLLEYGISLAVFDPQDWKEKRTSEITFCRRGSIGSVTSSGAHPNMDAAALQQEPDFNSPLSWRYFTSEPSVLQFLEERVNQEPFFRKQLLDYIEHSKYDMKWRTAASNAITILVRSGMQFNGADLRGIRIPRADLGNGIFDSAQLQGADLRNVDLRGVWLKRANLCNAEMTGVHLGEPPCLEHDYQVPRCLYSPDGKSIAVAVDNGRIHIYSTCTWEILWASDDYNNRFYGFTYSPKGKELAFGGEDNTVQIWDMETGVYRHILRGHTSDVASVAYSPQGDQVASASHDTTVKLWDMRTGDCRHTLTGHTSYVFCVAFSPNGNQIASGSDDCTIRLWDIETGECSHLISEHRRKVALVAYSPQGHQVASVEVDHDEFVNRIRVWNAATGECRFTFTAGYSNFYPFTYSPKGDQIASSNGSKILLWDIETGECLHTLVGHTSTPLAVAYSHQGDLVASASNDCTVRLWDAESGVCLRTLKGHSRIITSIAFSPKDDRVVSGSYDRTVRLWDVGARTSRRTSSGHIGEVCMIKCSPKGDQVASCSDDGTIRLWDVETGACQHVLRGHRKAVYCIVYSPRGDQIATGSADKTVRLWNVETGNSSYTLASYCESAIGIAYSPNGDQIAICSRDLQVQLWDVRSRKRIHTLTGHASTIFDITYSPNGNQIATCSKDGTVRLWDVETGMCIHIISSYRGWVHQVVYSPQGCQIACVSKDQAVTLWDAKTGAPHATLKGARIGSTVICTYSPDGGHIASVDDKTIFLWDAENGAGLKVFGDHSSSVRKIVYSPQGDMIVAAGDDKSVRLWHVESGRCRAVIQDFHDFVRDVAWVETPNASYVVVGCEDGMVGMWQVTVDGDRCQVRLHWRTTSGELDVKGATIQHIQGLSPLSKRILEQCGAVGDTASKKIARDDMAPMSPEESHVLAMSVSSEQSVHRVEQVRDPQLRDIGGVVAAFVRDMHGGGGHS